MGLDHWLITHARVASKPHRRVKLDDKMNFFHQLSTLVCSGTPLMQAIRICAEESQSSKLRQVLQQIAGRVAAGSSFHAATAQHGQVFEPHWVEVIRTGEITGEMGAVLVHLNKQIREAREPRRKFIGALLYPLILLAVTTVSMTIMLWFV